MPYDPNQPIEFLYRQVDEAVAFTDSGTYPFNDKQIVNVAVLAITASGVFTDDVKD